MSQHADNIFHGIANMNTTFKNGDVIAIRNPRGVEVIAIFDKFGSDSTLHIYVEFDTSEVELYFKCEDCDFCYDIDKIEYRLATDAEKENLYYHLFIHFTEDWDPHHLGTTSRTARTSIYSIACSMHSHQGERGGWIGTIQTSFRISGIISGTNAAVLSR